MNFLSTGIVCTALRKPLAQACSLVNEFSGTRADMIAAPCEGTARNFPTVALNFVPEKGFWLGSFSALVRVWRLFFLLSKATNTRVMGCGFVSLYLPFAIDNPVCDAAGRNHKMSPPMHFAICKLLFSHAGLQFYETTTTRSTDFVGAWAVFQPKGR